MRYGMPPEIVTVQFAPFSASAETMVRAAETVLAVQLELGRAVATAMLSAQTEFLHTAGRAVLDAQVRLLDAVLWPGLPPRSHGC